MDGLHRRRHLRTLALAAATLVLLATARPLAATAAVGDVVVISPSNEAPISGGDAKRPFSLQLPSGASCPGDSADGQFRVQSFLVPESVDPGGLVYRGLRPVAEGAWALYRTDTTTFMNAATNKAAAPGGEGAIINLPTLSFAVFEAGMIAPGRYHLGVACSLYSETKRFWSTEVDIVEDAESLPAGVRFEIVDPAGAGSRDEAGMDLATGAGVLLLVAAVGTVLVVRARRPRPRREEATS